MGFLLEHCLFDRLSSEIIKQCKSYVCKKDDNINAFFHDDTKDNYADYENELMGLMSQRLFLIIRITVSSFCFLQMKRNWNVFMNCLVRGCLRSSRVSFLVRKSQRLNALPGLCILI